MKRPVWLSESLYPFDSQYFNSDDGPMHYVDHGTGHPLLLVHGTPTWSFLYRNIIASLSQTYRVIAMDHLGFGLSAKPKNGEYKPQDHAERLASFIEYLGVEQFTLVVHDYGGPIGLSYAIHRPKAVSRLVLFNTWLWSLTDDTTISMMNRLVRGLLGRLFYCRFNGSPRFLIPAGWGEETPLTDAVHRHYTNPFQSVDDRVAPYVLARELIDATGWYESLWRQRSEIAHKPTLVMWGDRDPAFDESYLERLESTLTCATVHRLANTGHFVPDEAAAHVIPRMSEFLSRSAPRSR